MRWDLGLELGIWHTTHMRSPMNHARPVSGRSKSMKRGTVLASMALARMFRSAAAVLGQTPVRTRSFMTSMAATRSLALNAQCHLHH